MLFIHFIPIYIRLSTNMMSDINLSLNMLELVDPPDDDDETSF